MHKRYILIYFGFSIIGCGIRPTITKIKAKNATVVVSDTVGSEPKSELENSILRQKISLGNLLSYPLPNEGSFYAILINKDDHSTIEVKSFEISDDSCTISLLSKANKFQSTNFEFTIVPSAFRKKDIIQNTDSTYLVRLETEIQKERVSKSFTIRKSVNYLLTSGKVQLLTGEITNDAQSSYEFVAINDPDDLTVLMATMCCVTIPDYNKLSERCKKQAQSFNKCGPNVPLVYKIVTSDYLLFQKYYCVVNCKK
jgi:hypothetical protein